MEREQRRTQVLEYAQRIFARKGFHDTNVADIIAEAGIARGTFYLYFENKRELFETLLDQALGDIETRILRVRRGPGQPPAIAQVRANLQRVFEYMLAHSELLDILLHHASGFDPVLDEKLAQFSARLTADIERALSLGVDMGLVRPGNLSVAALCILGAVREVIASAVRTSPGNEPRRAPAVDELVESVLAVGLRGVATARLLAGEEG